MLLTKKSVQVSNKDSYPFRLEMDDKIGIIRLTKNRTNNKQTRITDRNIPIDEETKWFFHNNRTGYSEGRNEYNFIGSYVDRSKDPVNYVKWKNYILKRYKELKDETYN